MSSTHGSKFDPKDLQPAAVGFVIGLLIMAGFIVLGLSIGLTASIEFGVPHQ